MQHNFSPSEAERGFRKEYGAVSDELMENERKKAVVNSNNRVANTR